VAAVGTEIHERAYKKKVLARQLSISRSFDHHPDRSRVIHAKQLRPYRSSAALRPTLTAFCLRWGWTVRNRCVAACFSHVTAAKHLLGLLGSGGTIISRSDVLRGASWEVARHA
jgi:hypothetical protein